MTSQSNRFSARDFSVRLGFRLRHGIALATVAAALAILPAGEAPEERATLLEWLARRKYLRGRFREAAATVYIRVGHTISAGLVVHGDLFRGVNGKAGQIGHVTIVAAPGDNVDTVRDRARRAASYLRWGTEDGA